MSTTANDSKIAANEAGAESKTVRSRRRPGGPRVKKTDEGGEVNEETKRDSRPRRRPNPANFPKSLPVPENLIGQQAVGKVVDVIKRFSSSYGFIFINVADGSDTEKPKIYYNIKDYETTDITLRKGYEVTFTIQKDDKDRPYAGKINLTAEGRAQSVAREAKILADASAKPAALATSGENKENGHKDNEKRPHHRPRRLNDDTVVNVKVSIEGKQQVFDLEAKIYQSIGRLKYAAIEAFGVEGNYVIYANRSAETPQGVVLNKQLYRGLKDGDSLHLVPGPAVE